MVDSEIFDYSIEDRKKRIDEFKNQVIDKTNFKKQLEESLKNEMSKEKVSIKLVDKLKKWIKLLDLIIEYYNSKIELEETSIEEIENQFSK